MTADAFDNILGQPKVRDFLRRVVRNERVGQAYLFTGPAGSNKTMAAYALAQALICPKGAKGPLGGECGACDACKRIVRKKHPDVRYFAPEGASGYLVEQVRDIVSDVALAPIQANVKIYILDRVDMLGTSAANAFLKTLEEPPDDVVLVLLARTADSVLPTIVSRCQVVPFRHIPAQEAAGILSQNSGASLEQSRMAIEACGGSITKAAEFLKSTKSLEFRTHVLTGLSLLENSDDWDVLRLASDFVVGAKAPLDEVRVEQQQELEENAEFLDKARVRLIEARNKRALSAKTTELLRRSISIVASWLRDVLATCAGSPDLVVNVDARQSIEHVASRVDEARVVKALDAVERCSDAISYNVSPETCFDAMLFEVKEALFAPLHDVARETRR